MKETPLVPIFEIAFSFCIIDPIDNDPFLYNYSFAACSALSSDYLAYDPLILNKRLRL